MSQTVRTALIGCGKRAASHVPGILADPRCQVVAVADAQQEAAEAFQTTHGFDAAIYTDYRQMLAEVRPDFIITCLWTPLHLPVFRDCVAAGVKAVHSEKPVAPTWGECLEIGRLAETSGCQLTFCHQRRFATGNRLVRQLIDEGRLGTLQRMELYSPQNLLDCGTHTLDQALSFHHETPVQWVLGALDASTTLNWFDVRSETVFVGTLVFADGVRATLQAGGPDMDIWGGVRVTGSEGFIEVEWDGQILRAVRYDDPAWTVAPVADSGEAHMIGVIKNALDCLETGAEPELSFRKALRAEEVIFAFYESVRRHARVELPLTGVTDNPFISLLEQGAVGAGVG